MDKSNINIIKSQTQGPNLLFLVVCVLSLAGLLVGWLSFSLRTAFFPLTNQIIRCYRFPFVNSNTVGEIDGINLNLYLFGFCFFAGSVLVLWRYAKNRFLHLKGLLASLKIYPMVGLVVLGCAAGMQTLNHVSIFANEWALFQGKSEEEKLSFIHKGPYGFALFCKSLVDDDCRGIFETDLNINRDPGMEKHRKLAYFLYPEIDIRHIGLERPTECLIVFRKKDPLGAIPADFRLKGIFNETCLLAVRKNGND